MAEIALVLTICIPWLGAMLVWLIGDTHPRVQHTLAVLFSLAGGAASLLLLFNAGEGRALTLRVGGAFGDFTFAADGLGVFLAAVAAVIGSLAVLFSVDYMRGEAQLGRYYEPVPDVRILGDHRPVLVRVDLFS
jgi:NADH-quinone oxidoreductase subunit L